MNRSKEGEQRQIETYLVLTLKAHWGKVFPAYLGRNFE